MRRSTLVTLTLVVVACAGGVANTTLPPMTSSTTPPTTSTVATLPEATLFEEQMAVTACDSLEEGVPFDVVFQVLQEGTRTRDPETLTSIMQLIEDLCPGHG